MNLVILHPSTVPATPPTITAFNVSSPYFALVEWNPPTTPNGLITHYNLYVDYENGTNDTFIIKGQVTMCNITDLLPYQLISVELSANTSVGEGPRCPRVTDQTAQSCKHNVMQTKNNMRLVFVFSMDNTCMISGPFPASIESV